MASKKFALNSPLSESDRGGLERKLFGGVCGKKASLKIAWDAFRAVDATFRLFLGVCVATETSEDRWGCFQSAWRMPLRLVASRIPLRLIDSRIPMRLIASRFPLRLIASRVPLRLENLRAHRLSDGPPVQGRTRGVGVKSQSRVCTFKNFKGLNGMRRLHHLIL